MAAVTVSGLILSSDGSLLPGSVRAAGEVIEAVDSSPSAATNRIIAPGFVDLQVNGVEDVDCSSAVGHEWTRAAERLAATGVTAWLPTLISQPLHHYDRQLAAIGDALSERRGPAVLGAHLEGPFLQRPGAHRPEHLRAFDSEWLDGLPEHARLITVAPELADAPDTIRRLVERGVVVSLGHSSATREQATAATSAGASLVTHLFNGMPPLHHREPGLVGAALADDRLTVCLIADGVHVDPSLFSVVFRAKGPDRVVLVTDAVAWRSARLAALDLAVVDGAPRLPDGTLAGSALTMIDAVRNTIAAGVSVGDALRAASTNPSRVLGDDSRGAIEAGRRADLVVLDAADLSLVRTMVGGETVWER